MSMSIFSFIKRDRERRRSQEAAQKKREQEYYDMCKKREQERQEKWDFVVKHYPIGSKFTYLGVPMIVKGHEGGWEIAITCEYVDGCGNFQLYRFGYEQRNLIKLHGKK